LKTCTRLSISVLLTYREEVIFIEVFGNIDPVVVVSVLFIFLLFGVVRKLI
jgi:hypothetical protein